MSDPTKDSHYNRTNLFWSLQLADWIGVHDFHRFYHSIRRLNFSYVKDRQTFYSEYGSLDVSPGWNEFLRYDKGAANFTTYDVRVRQALDLLRSAAAYRDLQKDQADKTAKNGGDSRKDEVNGASYNDAANSFRQGIKEIEEIMLSPSYIWGRGRFEGLLVWNVVKPAPKTTTGGTGGTGTGSGSGSGP